VFNGYIKCYLWIRILKVIDVNTFFFKISLQEPLLLLKPGVMIKVIFLLGVNHIVPW